MTAHRFQRHTQHAVDLLAGVLGRLKERLSFRDAFSRLFKDVVLLTDVAEGVVKHELVLLGFDGRDTNDVEDRHPLAVCTSDTVHSAQFSDAESRQHDSKAWVKRRYLIQLHLRSESWACVPFTPP